jgi:hypothetical protein
MTDRKTLLIEVLKTRYNSKEISDFLNYRLNKHDLEFLKTVITETLRMIPPDAYNCGNLSALLGAIIIDNSEIKANIITGHLDYNGKRLFNCKNNIPTNSTDEIWSGHCWIELAGYILDISIFRTVYYAENFPELIKNEIINKYGTGKGSLMIPVESCEDYGFTYTPCFILSEQQINGLVSGTKEKYLSKN